jgi:STE24 endopeptidase
VVYHPTVRIVLLLSLFVIWNADLPGWQLLPPQAGISVFFAGCCAIILAIAVIGRRWTRRLGGVGPVARPTGYFHLLGMVQFFVPVWFAIGVFALGWRPLVDRFVGTSLLTPGTLIGILPGLFTWAGLWWAAFPVERAVREMNVVYDVEAGLPVFAFPTLVQYLGNRFRGQLLFLVVPVLMVLLVRDLIATTWTQLLGHSILTDAAESVVEIVAVVTVMVISPEVLRHVLQTIPLPNSPLRDRLAAVSRSAGIGCRDILLWNTHFNTGNAAVMGLVRPVRYVMLSDLLVESMTEPQLESVFAHELGHVRHRHLFWFGAFLIGVGGGVFSALDWIEERLPLRENGKIAFALAAAAAAIAGLLLAFSFISRWFERQADVFAARSFSDDVERGAHIFASALNRIAVVNNIAPNAFNWTHGSIEKRSRYVMKLATDPAEAERFDRRGRRFAVGLAAAIAVGIAAAFVSAAR